MILHLPDSFGRAMVYAWIVCLASAAQAATLTVNSSADTTTVDGQCTLREAINASNTATATADCPNTGAVWGTSDTIAFNIPGATDVGCTGANGVCTIGVTGSALPAITRKVTIDGYTQPGAATNTLATNIYPSILPLTTQLRVQIDGTLVPADFEGLHFDIGASNSRVTGLAVGNFPGFSACIRTAFGTTGVLIQGNFIGMRPDGQTVAACHLGIWMDGSGEIGGLFGRDRNLISGSRYDNVQLTRGDITVMGNLIGTDASGTAMIGGGGNGINATASSGTISDILISRNAISGHSDGYGIRFRSVTNSTITENGIGVGVGGAAHPNRNGVLIDTLVTVAAAGNSVYGNGIAHNTNNGIAVEGVNGLHMSGNRLDSSNAIWDPNWIFGNGQLGINMRPFGEAGYTVTANDVPAALDADTGPNSLQNFPVITSATVNGGNVDIVFSLDSAANTDFDIRAYANDACATSGHGQGQYPAPYLPIITTNSIGNAGGTRSVPLATAGWAAGKYVSLIATDVTGGNTSEFSACVQIPGAPAALPAATINDNTTYEGNSGTTAFNFTVSLSSTPTAPVNIHWSTSNGTATAASGDYAAGSGYLTWAAGDGTPRTVTILVNGDTAYEASETFLVVLDSLGLTGATLGDSTGLGTISNDDSAPPVPPTLSFSPTSLSFGNQAVGSASTPRTVTVTNTGATPLLITAASISSLGDFTIQSNNCIISLAPAASCTIGIVFTPAAAGARSASLAIVLSGRADSSLVPLSGNGTASVTAIEPIPTLSEWGLILLSLLLAGVSFLSIGRKKTL
ncbi:MAG: IPTL-CTERM sorting domain-containing protein [Comamonadaceae bacterium]|nr:IPTL-CTERM sorting domain-containing protein [Comamonadaceae bacterium]